MRRKIVIFVVIAVLLICSAAVAAPTPTFRGFRILQLFVDGQPVTNPVPTIMIDKTIMVDLRMITRYLGGKVQWNNNAGTVNVTSRKIGKGNLLIDGTLVGDSVTIINGRAMVPLAIVSKHLGGKTQWDGATKTVKLTSLKGRFGKGTLIIDGKKIGTNNGPVILDGKTLIPLNVVNHYLGGKAVWDPASRTVWVTSYKGSIGKANLIIDGKRAGSPMVMNGRTLVQLNTITKALGGKLQWNPISRTATVTSIKASMARVNITINGQPVTGANPPPMVLNGRTMIPLNIVTKSLGAKVLWDNNTRTVKVTSLPGRIERVKLNGRAAGVYFNLSNSGQKIKDVHYQLLKLQQSVNAIVFKVEKEDPKNNLNKSFQRINSIIRAYKKSPEFSGGPNTATLSDLIREGHDFADVQSAINHYNESLEALENASFHLMLAYSNSNQGELKNYYSSFNASVDKCDAGLKVAANGYKKFSSIQQTEKYY